MCKAIVAICEVCWKQWEHRNTILHHAQHPWKQREIKDIDKQIHEYKNQYQSALYLSRNQTLFKHSATFIHQHSTTIKRQWLQSVAKARLRKLTADIIPVSEDESPLRELDLLKTVDETPHSIVEPSSILSSLNLFRYHTVRIYLYYFWVIGMIS